MSSERISLVVGLLGLLSVVSARHLAKVQLPLCLGSVSDLASHLAEQNQADSLSISSEAIAFFNWDDGYEQKISNANHIISMDREGDLDRAWIHVSNVFKSFTRHGGVEEYTKSVTQEVVDMPEGYAALSYGEGDDAVCAPRDSVAKARPMSLKTHLDLFSGVADHPIVLSGPKEVEDGSGKVVPVCTISLDSIRGTELDQFLGNLDNADGLPSMGVAMDSATEASITMEFVPPTQFVDIPTDPELRHNHHVHDHDRHFGGTPRVVRYNIILRDETNTSTYSKEYTRWESVGENEAALDDFDNKVGDFMSLTCPRDG